MLEQILCFKYSKKMSFLSTSRETFHIIVNKFKLNHSHQLLKLIFDMAMIYEAAAANLENITDYFVKTLFKDKNMFEIIKKSKLHKIKNI